MLVSNPEEFRINLRNKLNIFNPQRTGILSVPKGLGGGGGIDATPQYQHLLKPIANLLYICKMFIGLFFKELVSL